MLACSDTFGVESELLVKEYEFYRAVYCSLCKTGGRRVSRFSRFFLNYDFVFLALVRLALTREQVGTEKAFCPYRLKKKTVLAENDAVTYTTAAFGLLSYYKLCDDIADLRGLRRWKKRLLRPLFSRMRKKAAALYPALDAQVGRRDGRLRPPPRPGRRVRGPQRPTASPRSPASSPPAGLRARRRRSPRSADTIWDVHLYYRRVDDAARTAAAANTTV